jgi:hypothetical protein
MYMAPKPKPNKWVDIQFTIAAIAITSVLALWNMFAGPDKEKAAEKAAEQAAQMQSVTVAPATIVVSTMPPLGSTTLFGGEAPKPQVIVVQNQGGGGGGGGGGGSVTSTSSS